MHRDRPARVFFHHVDGIAAGALRVPFWEIAVIFTVASGLWYGVISWISFRVGEDWATVRETLEVVARDVGIGAVVAALVLVFFGWRIWKKRRAVKAAPKAEPPQGPSL